MSLRFLSVASFVILALLVSRQVECKAIEPENRASEVTLLVTSFYPSVSTTTILTNKVCAKLGATTLKSCRRRRQYWLDLPIIMSTEFDMDAYFREQFQPSPVNRVEPTQLVVRHDVKWDEPAIESSYNYINGESYLMRSADPFRISTVTPLRTSLVSIASAIISSLLTPVSTITSTVSAYSSIIKSTIFTATRGFTLLGCIPPNLKINLC